MGKGWFSCLFFSKPSKSFGQLKCTEGNFKSKLGSQTSAISWVMKGDSLDKSICKSYKSKGLKAWVHHMHICYISWPCSRSGQGTLLRLPSLLLTEAQYSSERLPSTVTAVCKAQYGEILHKHYSHLMSQSNENENNYQGSDCKFLSWLHEQRR